MMPGGGSRSLKPETTWGSSLHSSGTATEFLAETLNLWAAEIREVVEIIHGIKLGGGGIRIGRSYCASS